MLDGLMDQVFRTALKTLNLGVEQALRPAFRVWTNLGVEQAFRPAFKTVVKAASAAEVMA